MIAHLQYPGQHIDFHTISRYVPAGAGQADDVWRRQTHVLRPRFIKAHARFQPTYPRVIYVVQDGRAAYVSYYAFLKENLPSGTTLARFVKKRDLPFGSWSQHVRSWMDAGLSRERLLLIKYEDMLRDPVSVLRRISRFSGTEWSAVDMRRAARESSFERMRAIEDESGFPSENVFSGRFMREGQAHGWRAWFDEAEKRAFKQCHGKILIQLGYEVSDSW